MWSTPRSRPSCTFFCMLSPSVATLRPLVDGRVGDLLDAVEVAGEAGGDDAPAVVLGEQRRAARRRRCVSLGAWPGSSAFVESASSSADARRSWRAAPMRARSVRRPSTGVRSSLKSPECRIDALRRVHGDGVGVRAREWVTGMNSTSNGPICDRSPSATAMQLGAPEQAGLLDAVAGQAERERRAVDRERLTSRSRNWRPPTWSSWPCVATSAVDARRRSRAGR